MYIVCMYLFIWQVNTNQERKKTRKKLVIHLKILDI
jgi:hypothetical protein